jgi:hypothetical protein
MNSSQKSYYVPDFSSPSIYYLLQPAGTKDDMGILTYIYDDIEAVKEAPTVIYGTTKAYQGTESNVNETLQYLDTRQITTWARQGITTASILYDVETETAYKVITEPEDIGKKHIYCVFKVQRTEL